MEPFVRVQAANFSEEDVRFLDTLEREAFEFFLYEHNPRSGLVKDKAANFTRDSSTIASIAATGFGLSAMVVGAERGWVPKEEARDYCTKTLRFFLNQMESVHGFFYHFVHWETGKKTKSTELSSIDTALFLAGALTAGEYFKGTEVEALASQIYERVDFPWMMNGGKTLSMGWDLQAGFLKARWSDYNESFLLYLLAIGSPTHSIPAESWHAVSKQIGIYGPHVFIYSPPLFTHQYSHLWVDFRNKNDGFADYFENSRIATLVNRQFSLDHRDQYKTYSENVWGLTASMGPGGYQAYGSGPGRSLHDGTVAPTAASGSIVFTPELSLNALKQMHDNFKGRLWGKYGPSDAFNLDRNWFAREVLGIDQGPIVLAIENLRSELIWKLFMRRPEVQRGMERIGFRPGTIVLQPPPRPKMEIWKAKTPKRIDGQLDDWDFTNALRLQFDRDRELGEFSSSEDAGLFLGLAWDEGFLYAAAKVSDESLIVKNKAGQIWRDDILELFFDPQGDGFEWDSPKDIQLGFSFGTNPDDNVRTWTWPTNVDPVAKGEAALKVERVEGGYEIEARVSWKALGIEPRRGVSFGFSPALHDRDGDGSEGKLTWHFIPDGKSGGGRLGEAVLVDA